MILIFVDILAVRRGENGCHRVGRNRAGVGIAPHFRPCEQRLVTRTIDCADGDEEAVAWIEAECLRRDQSIIAFRNDDTPPLKESLMPRTALPAAVKFWGASVARARLAATEAITCAMVAA